MLNKGLFTSTKQSYATPKALYDVLNAEFNFNDDPCPISEPNPFYENDGLAREWNNRVFINPPYGKGITKWIERAYREAQLGKLIVLLIPSRTDTRWWHDYVMKATEIRFIRGRLKFGDSTDSAPFPSAIVIFSKETME
jgi:hypothetical protein